MKRNSFIVTLLSVLLISSGVSLFAQTIERRSDLPVVGKSLSKLKFPYDYYKLDGEWRDTFGHGGELDLRTVEFEGKEYFLFIKTTIEGGYRYPNLQMDYVRWLAYEYFLIDKTKLAEFIPENAEFNKAYAVHLDPAFSFKGTSTPAKDMYLALEKRKTEGEKLSRNAMLAVFPVIRKEKRWVRYFIKTSWDEKRVTFDPLDFDKAYYEAEYEEFYRFANMGKRAQKYNPGKEK